MDDEQTLFANWIAARDAYDEHLQRLFMPPTGRKPERPSPEVLEEAGRLRELEEVTRLRYYASRGLSGT